MEALKLNVHIGEDGKIIVDTPLKNCDAELLVLLDKQTIITRPTDEKISANKYDFSDLVGKLQWKGDFLEEQKKIRDEWE